MIENPTFKLEIFGHTDNSGDPDRNLGLSQKRCNSVKLYLSTRGVSVDRMTAIGFGQLVPVSDNKTSEGRAKNRRVEFKLTF